MPKISVLMPLYNTNEDYLVDAIESVLNQTFHDFELILLNDGSDNSAAIESIIRSYNDQRIRYYANEINLGVARSRNRLIELAEGKYLAIMDHDDISLPQRLEHQVNFLDKHEEVGVLGSWHENIPAKNIIKVPAENDKIEDNMMFASSMLHTTVMLRKSSLLNNNIKYEEYFSPAEDYMIFVRLLGKTKFANLSEVLLKYREHENNTSKKRKKLIRARVVEASLVARETNSMIWDRVRLHTTSITRIRLFESLLFLTIKKNLNITKVYLFGFIPILSMKTKDNI